MAQHDYVIDNSTGANVRADINGVLQAIASNNSGSSAPSTTFALQSFANTTDSMLQLRNAANNAFVNLRKFDGTLPLPDGTVSSPSLFFDDDTNTGLFSSAADTLNFTTGGVERMELGAATIFNEGGADVDFRIEGDTDANLFHLDASADAIRIGGTPATNGIKFEVERSTSDAFVNASDAIMRLLNTNTSGNTTQASLQFSTSTTSTAADSAIVSQAEDASGNSRLEFWTDTSTGMTEKLVINSAGNVGIGDTDPDQKLCVEGSGTTILKVQNTDDGTAQITLGNTGSTNLNFQQVGGNTIFQNGGTERMRLSSDGLLMIGATAAEHSETRLLLKNNDHVATIHKNSNTNKTCLTLRNGRASGSTLGTMITIRNADGTTVGSVQATSSATQYNTSSDYRLKENVTAIIDAITRLKTLKPYRFNFKDNPDQTVDGFFAHEVTAVPEAVTEEKDSVITQSMIDSGDAPDGEVGDPIYQQIDQSKLVPLLTAALQESIVKIETLETKVEALEAA